MCIGCRTPMKRSNETARTRNVAIKEEIKDQILIFQPAQEKQFANAKKCIFVKK